MHTSALNYQSGNEMKMKSDKRSLQWVARRAQVAEERGDQCEGYLAACACGKRQASGVQRPPEEGSDRVMVGSPRLATDWTHARLVPESFQALPFKKDLGPGGITTEILMAGGLTSELFSPINLRVKPERRSIAWRGGRLITLWKRYGANNDADKYHGLALDDHASKAVAGQGNCMIDESFFAAHLTKQFGATSKRGCDFAHHTHDAYLLAERIETFIICFCAFPGFGQSLRS